MKQQIDQRIRNATIGFKNQAINSSALATIVECLHTISDGLSEDAVVNLVHAHEKGTCNNEHVGKN